MTTTILTFFRGRRGDTVSRLPDGKIALVNKNSRRPKPGEKWVCKFDFEKPNFVVVTPIAKIVKKQRQVLKKFKCGHTQPTWTEEVEVPEDIEPEPRVLDFTEPELCDECKKRCEHRNVEFTRSSFWVAVNCRDCRETLWTMDLREPEDADKAISEIRQRFPQLARTAEKSLKDWKQWKIEFTEKNQKHTEIVNKISELKKKIIELSGRKGDPEFEASFIVNPEKQRFEWTVVVKDAPNEVHSTMTWAPLPEEHREEILQLWEEVEELSRKEAVLHQWLTENRPVE